MKLIFARLVLIASISIQMMSGVGCCGRFDPGTKSEDYAASNWIHYWPGQYDWSQTNQWRDVVASRFPTAEALLANNRFVLLTDKQVRDLLEDPKGTEAFHGVAYLVRAVGHGLSKSPLDVFTRKNGDVWVAGGGVGRCPLPRQRRAVIVWELNPPNDAYATFSVAR
jgi:hypothetical protein